MMEIVVGKEDNNVDHVLLNFALKQLELEGFYGTSSFVRRTVDGVMLVVPRYIVVKTTAEIPEAVQAAVRQIVLDHVFKPSERPIPL